MSLTDAAAHRKKADPDKRVEVHDGAGLYLVIQPSGAKSWAFRYRVDGKSRKLTLGTLLKKDAQAETDAVGDLPALSVAEARQRASAAAVKVQRGIDPIEDHKRKEAKTKKTVSYMLDEFIQRYAKGKLKSVDQIESVFDRLVKPDIGDISIYDLRRSHVVEMLDEIADGEAGEDGEQGGQVMADRTLAYFRKACNWYATRDDFFKSPIVMGMRENSSEDRKRSLNEQEIRDLWAGLDEVQNVPACYPRFVKSLLLNMNRRNEAARMHSSEIDGDLWTIPGERYKRLPKHKGLDHVIPLSKKALELIGGKPDGCNANSWFVFSTTNGAKPFSGFSKCKRELDKAITAVRARDGRGPMENWRLHDLRRTGRTLMSAAGVNPDHAERALGHIIGGVRGTYDKHEFLAEKRAAFEALAGKVEMILNPPAGNVVALRGVS